MTTRFLLRLARMIDARPGKIAAAFLLVAAVSGVVVSRMPVRTDLLDVLPEGNPTILAFRGFLEDFGMMDSLVLVVSSRDGSPDRLIQAVETIGEELAASPRVASVDYNLARSGGRFVGEHFPAYLDSGGVARLSERLSPGGIRRQVRRNREALLSPFASPLDSEWISGDPLNLREIVRESLLRRTVAKGIDLSTGYYMDADRTVALLMVRPKGSSRDTAFVSGLYREVSGIAAKVSDGSGAGAGIKVGLAGGYASAAEAAGVIWRDMVVSFASSFVLVLLLVYLAFRPPPAVLGIFVLTLFAALSWTLLFAYLLYGGLNIVTSIVAAMLIGLYVDYMILTYNRFQVEIRAGMSPLQALETTFSETGKALVSSSATTSVAFFSVVVTSFRGLHELGVVAGFGILFCLLSSFLVMGSLLSWLAKVSPARMEAGRPRGVPMGWAERLVERRSGAVVAVFSIFLLLAILGSARTRFDAGVDAIGPVDSEVERVQRVIEEKFGRKGEPLFLVARADGDRRLAADFDALDLQGERWRRAGVVETFSSPAMLVPPPRFQEESRRLLSGAGLPGRYDDAGLEGAIRREMEAQGMVPGSGLAAYAAGIVRALAGDRVVDLSGLARSGDPRATYFFNGSRKAIAAHIAPPGGRWDPRALAAMKGDVRALGPDFALTGPPIIFDEIRSSIVRENILATIIAFAANWIIVLLHFRRMRDAALVMLPVTAGSLLTVGAMGAIGIPFNFFNVAGIALVFGFGVDYGIYFMQSRRESPAGGAVEALRRTGGSIALCAATTLASCGSLILSHYRGLASIGAVLCLGGVFCLLSTVLLLPSLIDTIEHRRTRKTRLAVKGAE
ncbi:MAG: MMPL family transporter [bacterium]|nr:MMPL family transporter [bacterium]